RAIILHNVPILDTEAGVPQPLPTLTVVYAAPTMDISSRIAKLGASISLASFVLVIPTLVLAVWSIRRALAPLNELAAHASLISVRNWSFRPSEEAKAAVELQPLIHAIETVLSGLERAFIRQREFLGDAAHELKTSLAILKSSWQSLLNRQRSAEEYRQGLSRISEDSDRLEELLNRMLSLARVEQWTAEGARRQVDVIDLASTCEMAVAKISNLAVHKNINIRFSAPEQLTLRADPGELELVWINLLENAVKYSAVGANISMTITREGQTALVVVSDSGPGIPDGELPRIFERFHRGDPSRARSSGGFGLGLAIAKSVVQAYQGSIRAESALGTGTRIFVRLPILASATAQPLVDIPAGQPVSTR
ncbi:MAG TPA: HAMP domain-containing sensor histidine kinase, partial [Terriglobales bacterium]